MTRPALSAALALLLCAGCLRTAPASRSTSADYGGITVRVERSPRATLNLTLGDGALASADSTGSTETQTATPTLDVRARLDARYNDAISSATDASRAALSRIGSGLGAVLDMMLEKRDGTVPVTLTGGGSATVRCEGGQCSICDDCDP